MPHLTIARLKRNSRVLGPGCRAVVWTHGCLRRCSYCIAEEMNETASPLEFTAITLYEWLKSVEGIEGVTITGGEPFEQPIETLEAFLWLVKNDSRRLSVVCYTGNSMVELLKDKQAARILEYVDILVDGPYIHELNDGYKWRGSSNQTIHALNAEYADIVWEAKNSLDRGIEISLSAEMQFELTGIPNTDFMKNFERQLFEKGYSLVQGLDEEENIPPPAGVTTGDET